MRLSVLSAVALVAMGAPAVGADLGMPRATPAISPLYDWSGLYVGLQAGYSNTKQSVVDRNSDDEFPDGASGSDHLGAFVGGGHAGYNFQRGRVVFGIEGDIEYNDGRDKDWRVGLLSWGFGTDYGFQGSVRGRLGYAFDRSLVYATAGLALGEFSFEQFCDFCGAGTTGYRSEVRVGWTVGAGLQYALDDRWSVRTEYRYTDFGSQTEDVSIWAEPYKDTMSLTSHAVRFGVSYALGK